MRSLNAALWMADAVHKGDADAQQLSSKARQFAKDVGCIAASREADWCHVDPGPLDVATAPDAQMPDAPGVVVFASNPRSLHVMATLHLLNSANVKVSHVLIRRLLSPRRLRDELAFSPSFLFKRVRDELLARERNPQPSNDSARLSSWLDEIDCPKTNVRDVAHQHDRTTVVKHFSDFNDKTCVDFLQHRVRPSYGVFAGGGLLKSDLLQTFSRGIVHAHPGILPTYRGMDVVQWAILEGRYDSIGSTCQLMTPALDGGPVLAQQHIDISQMKSLNEIRTAVVIGKIQSLVGVVRKVQSGGDLTISEQPTANHQYRLMHPALVQATDAIIGAGLYE